MMLWTGRSALSCTALHNLAEPGSFSMGSSATTEKVPLLNCVPRPASLEWLIFMWWDSSLLAFIQRNMQINNFVILSLKILYQIIQSWASGEHIYDRNHTHHTCVQYIWVKWKIVESFRAGGFFSWRRKTVLRGIFLSYSISPLKHAPPISCQRYGGLYHHPCRPHPWPTLYFYIIHLLKIQTILLLGGLEKYLEKR